MEEEFVPKESALCQSYTENGITVQIDIYEDGEGAWLLEIVDENNNTTVWEDTFTSEQGALDEALEALSEEGIASFVGSVSTEGDG
ncbi:hypothetical protein [Microbulbifer sp. 2201CG32-9]|uniref:hypothetical protein n=1 Tax=unclassified Microbulbifer TaxID=2619833 RepID=UPI00345C58CC